MTYKFEQFKIEIVDPVVTVDKEGIEFNYVQKTASASVTLTTPNGSKFGVRLEGMPIDNPDLNLVDIDNMVAVKLKEYEI